MTDGSATHAAWLDKLDQAIADWDALADGVGGDTDVVVAHGWTFTDIAAHLNGWREWTARRLEAAAKGTGAPVMPWPAGMDEDTDAGTDEINAWFQSQSELQGSAEVLEETREQFARMRAAITTLPPDALDQSPPWLDGYPLSAVIEGALEHFYDDHYDELERWLEQR